MARKEKYKLSRTTIFQVGDITHTKVNDLGVFESCGAALGEAELNYCAYTGSEDGIELFDHAKWNITEDLDGYGVTMGTTEADGSIYEYTIEYVGDDKKKDGGDRSKNYTAVRHAARIALGCGLGVAAYKIAKRIRRK